MEPPVRSDKAMRAWVVKRSDAKVAPVLHWQEDVAVPTPGPGEALLKVSACGVCHTDLHITEGELTLPHESVIPGHQVIGHVVQLGVPEPKGAFVPVPPGVSKDLASRLIAASGGGDERGLRVQPGVRVGVPWLYRSCGRCQYCLTGRENLCENPQFTGFFHDGGYAEYMVAPVDFLVPIPARFDDEHAAPLLCAGIIGYRSLRLAGVTPDRPIRLGLFGFGASAHLALQVARHWETAVYVFTRNPEHRRLALALGASWAGATGEEPPVLLEAAVTFAPTGAVIPAALRVLAPGGTLAVNAVHLDGIPAFPYELLYGERVLRSVANATRQDAWEWMYWADVAGIDPHVEIYSVGKLPDVLGRLKKGEIQGSAVVKLP